MTLIFDGDFLERHVDNALAMRAMRDCFDTEAAGKTKLPARIDTPTGKGFIRVMPALFDDATGDLVFGAALAAVAFVGAASSICVFSSRIGAESPTS